MVISQRKADRELESVRRSSVSADSSQLIASTRYDSFAEEAPLRRTSRRVPRISRGSLSSAEADADPFAVLGGQTLRWDGGENAAKRQRVEHDACVGGLRGHSTTMSHGHGLAAGHIVGEQQQQQLFADRMLMVAVTPAASDEGDSSPMVPSIGLRGLKRVRVAANATADAPRAWFATSHAPLSLLGPPRSLLGGCSLAGFQLGTDSYAVDRTVPAASTEVCGPSVRTAACVPQPAAGYHQASGTAEVPLLAHLGGDWDHCLAAAGLDTPMLDARRLLCSSLTTADTRDSQGQGKECGRSSACVGAGVAERRADQAIGEMDQRAVAGYGKEPSALEGHYQAQVVITGAYGFQAAFNFIKDPPNELRHASVSSAVRETAASKRGSADRLQVLEMQHGSNGEIALQQLLCTAGPTEMLSVEAAAAFPSLVLFGV